MNSFTTLPNVQLVEFKPMLGDRDFVLRIKRYGSDSSYNGGQTWVQLDETVCTNGNYWMKFIFSTHVDAGCDLEVLREAFKGLHHRLKRDVRSWAQYRYWASLEKGGKRAYYSKHANFWRGQIKQAAENWTLAKAIWRVLVRL